MFTRWIIITGSGSFARIEKNEKEYTEKKAKTWIAKSIAWILRAINKANVGIKIGNVQTCKRHTIYKKPYECTKDSINMNAFCVFPYRMVALSSSGGVYTEQRASKCTYASPWLLNQMSVLNPRLFSLLILFRWQKGFAICFVNAVLLNFNHVYFFPPSISCIYRAVSMVNICHLRAAWNKE